MMSTFSMLALKIYSAQELRPQGRYLGRFLCLTASTTQGYRLIPN